MERWGRHGRENIERTRQRFFEKVHKTDTCWLWTGSGQRYGNTMFRGRAILAHRLSWELHRDPIPVDMNVCHSCDVPRCVNPDHLFLGTQNDNVIDMENKRRSRHPNGSAHGRAKLTEAQAHEARKRHAAGEAIRAIARDYGVSKTAIAGIVHGRTWTHHTIPVVMSR